jgi:hypothetical protein
MGRDTVAFGQKASMLAGMNCDVRLGHVLLAEMGLGRGFSPLLGWLKALFRPSRSNAGRLAVDHETISYVRPDGRVDTLRWAHLQMAGVETNDGGPFIKDVYVLRGSTGLRVISER